MILVGKDNGNVFTAKKCYYITHVSTTTICVVPPPPPPPDTTATPPPPPSPPKNYSSLHQLIDLQKCNLFWLSKSASTPKL